MNNKMKNLIKFNKNIKMKKIIKNETGSYAIIAAVMIPIFLLMAALAVDMSILFAARVELLKASDIAAIEVSKYLDLEQPQISEEGYIIIIKSEYADYATEWVKENFNNKFGGSLDEVSVRFGPINSNENPEIVYVQSTANIPLHFAKIIGMASTDVSVEGSARIREVK